ncbi:acyl-coenzyme A thioesterase 1-like isoform X2 [Clupea harengus]|uniref:Acyl-coenzyme A thioesterase 1-like isoform X2 n=1 Tax=Clupea harengus TaxID=7950 RepID=A0A6P8FI85_CLUHA|nr:acyl-coenzyme A thioesterase 1-like isoform X2 [Clupea harengus]
MTWTPLYLLECQLRAVGQLRVSLHRKMCNRQAQVRWRSAGRPAPLLTARPTRALVDEPISIEAHHLPSHTPITVRANLTSEDGDLWEALSHYYTDAKGAVNLMRDPSMGGSYVGCEPMGLFWALQPVPGSREGLRLRKRDVETPYAVHLSLLEGHVNPEDTRGKGSEEGQELAKTVVDRWYMAPGVRRIEVRQNGVVGSMFLPPGPGPFPAVLDLWGMGGGLVEYRSALLASHGMASLALAYFGHKDIPGPLNRINVGDSYFRAAFQLLQKHPQVCEERIGVMGLSFGVYLSLWIASQLSVKPRCVVGINGPLGSFNTFSSEDGQQESFEENQRHWSYDEQGYVSFREVSLPSNIPSENYAKVEDMCCPLLYIVGKDDLSCASLENADEIEKRLHAAGKSHLFTRLSYPGAGHLIEPPYAPNARVSLWTTRPAKLFPPEHIRT